MSTQQNEQIRLSIFDKLVIKFSSYVIPADAAAQEIKPGMSSAAVRTAIHRDHFPVPTEKIMGTNMVRLADLATFLSGSNSLSTSVRAENVGVNDLELKRKRGQRGPGKRRGANQGGDQ
ncbi:MAG: hypothetical protein PHI29_03530 [Gallionella sp.]|nr:hypothetical protein [Gallionella sp.]